MKIFSPLEHFEINIYTYLSKFYYDFSMNSGNVYLLSVLAFVIYLFLSLRSSTLLPTRSGKIALDSYNLLLGIYKQQVTSPRALRFFPLIYSLFIFIFILNFTSLYVYGVSLTGHILVTAYFSFSIFFSLIIIGLLTNGKTFFGFFVPSGVPKVLLDFIIVIEVFSFAVRPFSLSIRLFANMLAGHTLLGIFAKFSSFVLKNYLVIFVLPLALVFAVFFLEIAVSLIQAYIFVSLICIYINDVINLH